jgi:hypothetical protein
MSEFQAEIAVLFKPKDARSSVLYNVPLCTKRTFKLYIHPKVGTAFSVKILPLRSEWLRLNHDRGEIPFTVTATIDTTGLEPVSLYKEDLIFTVNGVEVHKEPIYLSTQLYESEILAGASLVTWLNPGKRKKNILISVLTLLEIIRNFLVAIVFLWILVLALSLILIIVSVAGSG